MKHSLGFKRTTMTSTGQYWLEPKQPLSKQEEAKLRTDKKRFDNYLKSINQQHTTITQRPKRYPMAYMFSQLQVNQTLKAPYRLRHVISRLSHQHETILHWSIHLQMDTTKEHIYATRLPNSPEPPEPKQTQNESKTKPTQTKL